MNSSSIGTRFACTHCKFIIKPLWNSLSICGLKFCTLSKSQREMNVVLLFQGDNNNANKKSHCKSCKATREKRKLLFTKYVCVRVSCLWHKQHVLCKCKSFGKNCTKDRLRFPLQMPTYHIINWFAVVVSVVWKGFSNETIAEIKICEREKEEEKRAKCLYVSLFFFCWLLLLLLLPVSPNRSNIIVSFLFALEWFVYRFSLFALIRFTRVHTYVVRVRMYWFSTHNGSVRTFTVL